MTLSLTFSQLVRLLYRCILFCAYLFNSKWLFNRHVDSVLFTLSHCGLQDDDCPALGASRYSLLFPLIDIHAFSECYYLLLESLVSWWCAKCTVIKIFVIRWVISALNWSIMPCNSDRCWNYIFNRYSCQTCRTPFFFSGFFSFKENWIGRLKSMQMCGACWFCFSLLGNLYIERY